MRSWLGHYPEVQAILRAAVGCDSWRGTMAPKSCIATRMYLVEGDHSWVIGAALANDQIVSGDP